jgi:hypothetical protein
MEDHIWYPSPEDVQYAELHQESEVNLSQSLDKFTAVANASFNAVTHGFKRTMCIWNVRATRYVHGIIVTS